MTSATPSDQCTDHQGNPHQNRRESLQTFVALTLEHRHHAQQHKQGCRQRQPHMTGRAHQPGHAPPSAPALVSNQASRVAVSSHRPVASVPCTSVNVPRMLLGL